MGFYLWVSFFAVDSDLGALRMLCCLILSKGLARLPISLCLMSSLPPENLHSQLFGFFFCGSLRISAGTFLFGKKYSIKTCNSLSGFS